MTLEKQSGAQLTDEQVLDRAIELTGTGKFTWKIVAVCAVTYFNTSFVTNSISLVFPAAACDFDLSTMDAGVVTATPFLGMIVGSYFWGCLADLSGRRYALTLALFAQGSFEAISGIVPNYWGFLVFKFLSGFSLIAQNAVVFPYLAEFQSVRLRNKILCTLEIAWVFGTMALPAFAWLIIPLDVSYTNEYFFFHSWNLFVVLYSLMAPLLALCILTFPESPKYLAEVGNDEALAMAFDRMHQENCGESFEKFLNKLTDRGLSDLRLRLELRKPKNDIDRVSKCDRTRRIFFDIFRNTAKLLKSPFLVQTILTCALMFFIASTYFSFTLWFPELVRRLENYEEDFPDEPTWICSAVPDEIIVNNVTGAIECLPEIPTEVYMHTLIIGAACLPSNILVPIFVDTIGYKVILAGSSLLALAVTAGLFFVQSSTQNLILSAIYESFTSIGLALVLVVITQLYPTQVRATASSFGLLFARIGSVVGNLLMGHLIDHYCQSFIISIIIQLFLCVVMAVLLPVTTSKKKENQPVTIAVYKSAEVTY